MFRSFRPQALGRTNLTSLLSTSTMNCIKTFVFLDLETTGLPQLEYNKTKITEFCAVAVQASHIELGCFPRVHNKLTLCLNPNKMIQPECTTITGLSNELLEQQTAFSNNVVNVIKNWLSLSESPICFVAHNGDRFDYPILRAELHNASGDLSEEIVCVDSLKAFKALDAIDDVAKPPEPEDVPAVFDDGYDELLCQIADEMENKLKQLTPAEMQKLNEKTPKKQKLSGMTGSHEQNNRPKKNLFQKKRCFKSYKLKDIYERLTKKQAIGAHEAEGDVAMLITCAAVFGEKFVAYANENAEKFSEVPMMTPGKKLGTL